jgi:SOS response regulatory protein OraA/RecX
VDGVFNDNLDGFFNESGAQKFDDPESGIVSQLREALNSAIRAIGELNASIGLANNVINFFTDQGQEGAGLIEQVAMFTGLPKELIQRLYVFKLRELGKNVQEATTLSGLSENLVKELYARGYLDDGKTVEETVELSGLTEDKVRRVFASKLLDDELNAENPDDVLDLTRIAEQAGLSEEIVREIRAQKLADLQTFSEEESEQLVA